MGVRGLGAPSLCWRVHVPGRGYRVHQLSANIGDTPHPQYLCLFLLCPESWNCSQIITTFIFCFYGRHPLHLSHQRRGEGTGLLPGWVGLLVLLPCIPRGLAQQRPQARRTIPSRGWNAEPVEASSGRAPRRSADGSIACAQEKLGKVCRTRASGWTGHQSPSRTAGPQPATSGWGRRHCHQGQGVSQQGRVEAPGCT